MPHRAPTCLHLHSPFGAAAAGGASPFGPYGAANPFSPGFTPPAAPVDTTATSVSATGAAATTAADASRGDKFAARASPVAPAAAATATATATPAAAADKPATGSSTAANGGTATATAQGGASSSGGAVDVVEPVVKEPTGAGAGGGGPQAAGFFTDVGEGGGAAGAGGAPQDPAQMTAMMEKMLRDPNMQKMLYPYLPEPMRNPQSIEWMLNNPEVRKQMEGVFAQSVRMKE